MSLTLINPSSLACIAMCVGPIFGVFILWQILKILGLEYWIRVPRQSRLKQWGQYGLLILFYFIVTYVSQTFTFYLLGIGFDPEAGYSGISIARPHPSQTAAMAEYNKYELLVTVNMILGWTLLLFGVVLLFMQTWIKPDWVKWVAQNFPEYHRDLLVFASKGEERRKWRRSKDFEEFQQWVRDYAQKQYGIESL